MTASGVGPGCCGLSATLKADSPRNNATASIYLASRPSSSACCGASSIHTHTRSRLRKTSITPGNGEIVRIIRDFDVSEQSRVDCVHVFVVYCLSLRLLLHKSADCSVEHLLCPLRFSPFLSCQLSIYTRRVRLKFASFPRLKPNLKRVLFTRNLFILSYRNGRLVLNDSYLPF